MPRSTSSRKAFARAIREHGPDAVAFYVSGQLLTEDYYVINKLAKGFVGTANIDTNSRLCMASSVAGHKRAFGSDTVPGCYEDLELADLLILVGSNAAWCHPGAVPAHDGGEGAKSRLPHRRHRSRAGPRPARAPICICRCAPAAMRCCSTACWLRSKRAGAVDGAFVRAFTTGADAALAAVADQTVAQTAADLRACRERRSNSSSTGSSGTSASSRSIRKASTSRRAASTRSMPSSTAIC